MCVQVHIGVVSTITTLYVCVRLGYRGAGSVVRDSNCGGWRWFARMRMLASHLLLLRSQVLWGRKINDQIMSLYCSKNYMSLVMSVLGARYHCGFTIISWLNHAGTMRQARPSCRSAPDLYDLCYCGRSCNPLFEYMKMRWSHYQALCRRAHKISIMNAKRKAGEKRLMRC